MSHAAEHRADSARYAKCIEVSKRIRWDTDRDVIRGRGFDFGRQRLRFVVQGPDGALYVGTDGRSGGDEIWRVVPQ